MGVCKVLDWLYKIDHTKEFLSLDCEVKTMAVCKSIDYMDQRNLTFASSQTVLI